MGDGWARAGWGRAKIHGARLKIHLAGWERGAGRVRGWMGRCRKQGPWGGNQDPRAGAKILGITIHALRPQSPPPGLILIRSALPAGPCGGGGSGGRGCGLGAGPVDLDPGPVVDLDSGPVDLDSGPVNLDSGPVDLDSGLRFSSSPYAGYLLSVMIQSHIASSSKVQPNQV